MKCTIQCLELNPCSCKGSDRKHSEKTGEQIYPLSVCTWFLKFLVWKIEFDDLDFWSSLNLIFAGYTCSRNQVQTRDFKNQEQIDRGLDFWNMQMYLRGILSYMYLKLANTEQKNIKFIMRRGWNFEIPPFFPDPIFLLLPDCQFDLRNLNSTCSVSVLNHNLTTINTLLNIIHRYILQFQNGCIIKRMKALFS